MGKQRKKKGGGEAGMHNDFDGPEKKKREAIFYFTEGA